MMTARPYYGTDYPTVSGWWESHGWGAVPEAFLPTNGLIVEDADGVALAAGFLKLESSTPMAMLEWCVANNENKPRVSVEALAFLVGAARTMAKAMGRTTLFTYCKQQSLAKLYEKCGFQRSDTEMIHLVCNL